MRLVEPCRVDGAHAFGATSVSWVPGTTRMVTASLDETVKEWEDVPDEGPRLLHEYHGHGMGVVSVAVDATGEAVGCMVAAWAAACIYACMQPQIDLYYACRGQGRPESEDMHALTCPEAGGRGAFTCMHV
eukprot:352437-Chlamydomonas_euryale.AAC.3